MEFINDCMTRRNYPFSSDDDTLCSVASLLIYPCSPLPKPYLKVIYMCVVCEMLNVKKRQRGEKFISFLGSMQKVRKEGTVEPAYNVSTNVRAT